MALCWRELQICRSIEAGDFHPGSALPAACCELESRLADRNVPSANPSEMRALSTIQAQPVLSRRSRCGFGDQKRSFERRMCIRRRATGVANEAPPRKPLRLQRALVGAPPPSRKLLAWLQSPIEPDPEVF